MRFFNISLAVALLLILVACNSENDQCSDSFKTAYSDLKTSFKNSYVQNPKSADIDKFKSQLGDFTKNYNGKKCTIDGIGVVDPSTEVNKLIVDFQRQKSVTDDKVVYGTDDRIEVSDAKDPRYIDWSKAVAAQIDTGKLYSISTSTISFSSLTLVDSMHLCPDERFAEQPAPARCSGFLVGPDILVTAGHCMKNARDCSQNAWVFGFDKDVEEFSVNDVYSCSAIIAQHLPVNDKLDFAVIKLDRAVTNRTPLHFRTEGEIPLDSKVIVIGHPSGLPTKIGSSGTVRSNSDPIFFVTNLDTFGGNSGSPVIDPTSGVVEGILVRGETDYYTDPKENCQRVYKCTNTGCNGEEVTRIEKVTNLPDQGPQVIGQWGNWSSWSSCVSGVQSRTHSCDNPAPTAGGVDCQGGATESRHCLAASESDIFNTVLFAPSVAATFYHSVVPVNYISDSGVSFAGRKFLGLCGVSLIDNQTGGWTSSAVADCSTEIAQIRDVFTLFEEVINTAAF